MKSWPAIISAIVILLLPIAYKHFQISDDIFNQVMGFLIGILSQQGITKVQKVRAAKHAKSEG